MEDYPMVNGDCPRMPNFHVSPRCPRPGMAIEIIMLLTAYLNLTIDVAKVRKYEPDYSYIYDELYNNETDLYAVLNFNTSTRAEKFEFTNKLYFVSCFYKTMLANMF
jgi:hypothetical protein